MTIEMRTSTPVLWHVLDKEDIAPNASDAEWNNFVYWYQGDFVDLASELGTKLYANKRMDNDDGDTS